MQNGLDTVSHSPFYAFMTNLLDDSALCVLQHYIRQCLICTRYAFFVSGGLREGAEELLHQARRFAMAGKRGGCVHEAEGPARMGKEGRH